MDPNADRELADSPAAPGGDDPLPDLPESLIPRWLALVVLIALVAAGAASAWLVLC